MLLVHGEDPLRNMDLNGLPNQELQPGRLSLWAILVLAAACLIPFLNKAFCIDDPLFLWTARQIQQTPTDFYGYPVNWYGTAQPISTVMKNPPLWSYGLAVVGLAGSTEVWFHACSALAALAVLAGTWNLATLLKADPARSGLLTLATPVFLVSSTNVMCDVALTAGWVWTIYFWKRGLDRGSHFDLALAALMITLTSFTKYFGIALIPLLLVYTWTQSRRLSRSMLWMGIPLLALDGFQVWTSSLYGTGLVLDAGQYSVTTKFRSATNVIHSLVTILVFLGGCLLPMVFDSVKMGTWPRVAWLIVPAVVAVGATLLFPQSFCEELIRQNLSLPRYVLIQVAVFAAVGAHLVRITIDDLRAHRSPESGLLFCWIVGTLLFAGGVNWTINGRCLLPLVPAMAIVISRRLADPMASGSRENAGKEIPGPRLITILPGLVLSLIVAWADFEAANSARRAAAELQAIVQSATSGVSFQGHWGFQYYMEQSGVHAMDFDDFDMKPGDIVIIPMNNTNINLPPDGVCRLKDARTIRQTVPCSTMNNQAGTGFYTSVWGPVPYSFGPAPSDRFLIVEVVKPIRKRKAF
jgi:hypothetical protein